MAWLTGWNYRKEVTVSNTGSTLSDYQVLTTIDTATLVTAGKMRTDCGDIRLTNDDGSTLLPYWIESDCNTASTKIWVKIPSVSTGTKTIYLYYGNASVTSISDGTNTFIQWHGYANSNFHDSNILTLPYIVEAIVNQVSGSNIITGVKTASYCCGSDQIHVTFLPNSLTRFSVAKDTVITVNDSATLLPANTDQRIKIIAVNNSYVTGSMGTAQFGIISTNIPTLALGLTQYYAVTGGYQKWSFARKYASPEPTLSTIGTEETPSNITATNMIITPSETPCRVGICTVTVNVTWTNTGGSSGDFIPNITIDGTPYSSPYPLESLGAGASIPKTFIVSGLAVGTRNICPYPN